jgi:hypothetical protein
VRFFTFVPRLWRKYVSRDAAVKTSETQIAYSLPQGTERQASDAALLPNRIRIHDSAC